MLRSKGNQTMKFGQLIEYNLRNIFLEKSLKNMVDKIFLDLFKKMEFEYISGPIA